MLKPMNSDISALTTQILNIISDPISIKNDQLQFVFVNDAFCALYNKNREAFPGRTLPEVSNDALIESTENQEKSVLETGVEQNNKLGMIDDEENSRTLAAKWIRLTDKADRQYVFCIMKNAAETQASKSRSPIARAAIHDLNNSLNIIRGYGELLLEDLAKDDPLREDLDAIYQAGLHAIDIASKF
jgi:signal transduction histidine kinase